MRPGSYIDMFYELPTWLWEYLWVPSGLNPPLAAMQPADSRIYASFVYHCTVRVRTERHGPRCEDKLEGSISSAIFTHCSLSCVKIAATASYIKYNSSTRLMIPGLIPRMRWPQNLLTRQRLSPRRLPEMTSLPPCYRKHNRTKLLCHVEYQDYAPYCALLIDCCIIPNRNVDLYRRSGRADYWLAKADLPTIDGVGVAASKNRILDEIVLITNIPISNKRRIWRYTWYGCRYKLLLDKENQLNQMFVSTHWD